METKEQVLT